MNWLRVLAARVRGAVRRESVLEEIDEEFRSHIDILTDEPPESIIPHLAGTLDDVQMLGQQRRIYAYEPAGKAALYRATGQRMLKARGRAADGTEYTAEVKPAK